MDADLKAKWVAALRSGAYEQGRKALLSSDGMRYCCLGVLADICGFALHPLAPGRYTDMGDKMYPILHSLYGTMDGAAKRAVRMNDEGASFADIADYLEANL